MKILDLTHLIEEAMPVYPETEPPKLTPSSNLIPSQVKASMI